MSKANSTSQPSAAADNVEVGEPVCTCWPAPPKVKPVLMPCKHESLKIECSHNGRKIELAPTPPLLVAVPELLDGEYGAYMQLLLSQTLQVVAGPQLKPDKIQCQTKIVEGPCPIHTNRVFNLTFPANTPGPTELSKTNTKLEFNARCHSFGEDILGHFWLPDARPRVYQIDTHTHDGMPLTGFVEVFPDLVWEIPKLEVGFDTSVLWKHQKKKDENVYQLNKRQGSRLFTWSGGMKWTSDGDSTELSFGGESKLKKILKLLDWLADKAEYFIPFLYDLTGTKFTLKTKLGVGGKFGWEEIKGKPTCGVAGSININFDPLLEIEVEQDVTDAILRALLTTPAAPVAARIISLRQSMKKAEQNYEKNELDKKDAGAAGYVNGGIFFTANGAIGLGVAWSKKAEEPKWSAAESKGKLSIGMQLKAKMDAKFKAKVWFVEGTASGSLEAGAKSSVTMDEIQFADRNGRWCMACKLIFNGVTVWYLAAVDGEIKLSNSEEEKSGDEKWESSKSGQIVKTDTTGNTTTENKVSAGPDGVSVEETKKTEEKSTNEQGAEVVQSTEETTKKYGVSTEGAEAKASYKATKTLLEPRMWNHTQAFDDTYKAPPLGEFELFGN